MIITILTARLVLPVQPQAMLILEVLEPEAIRSIVPETQVVTTVLARTTALLPMIDQVAVLLELVTLVLQLPLLGVILLLPRDLTLAWKVVQASIQAVEITLILHLLLVPWDAGDTPQVRVQWAVVPEVEAEVELPAVVVEAEVRVNAMHS